MNNWFTSRCRRATSGLLTEQNYPGKCMGKGSKGSSTFGRELYTRDLCVEICLSVLVSRFQRIYASLRFGLLGGDWIWQFLIRLL